MLLLAEFFKPLDYLVEQLDFGLLYSPTSDTVIKHQIEPDDLDKNRQKGRKKVRLSQELGKTDWKVAGTGFEPVTSGL